MTPPSSRPDATPSPPPRAWHRQLRSGALELLVALVAYGASTLILGGELARLPFSRVSAAYYSTQPEDYNGTVWFFAWVRRALRQDLDLLYPDTVCAPMGTSLGTNFPNSIDAIMASPLMGLPFPGSYNLWLAMVPVLGALAAYLALRAAACRPWVSLLGGWLFGFNAYSIFHLAAGRPTLGLLFVLPLFLAALLTATRLKGWKAALGALLAGLAGALAVHFYVLYGLLAFLMGLGIWLARLLRPPASSSRRTVALVGAATLLVAGFFSATYVYRATILQPRLATASSVELAQAAEQASLQGARSSARLRPWSPDLWRFLGQVVRDQLPKPEGEGPVVDPAYREQEIQALTAHSLPVDYGFDASLPASHPKRALPQPWLLPLVLLLGLAGGRRAWPWVAATALLYLLPLGPFALLTRDQHLVPWLVGGDQLRLPGWYALQLLPVLASFAKPERLFPGLLLALVMTLGLALEQLQARSRGWLERVRISTRGQGILWAVAAGLLLLGAALPLHERAGLLQQVRPFEPHPFHQQLADMPGNFAIVELPMGLGHGLAAFQLVHGKRRVGDHHDALGALRAGEPPPLGCFQLELAHVLWTLGRDEGAGGAPPLTASILARAWRQDIRYLLVYPEAYATLAGHGVRADLQTVQEQLDELLGPAVYSDDLLVAYSLDPALSRGQ